MDIKKHRFLNWWRKSTFISLYKRTNKPKGFLHQVRKDVLCNKNKKNWEEKKLC